MTFMATTPDPHGPDPDMTDILAVVFLVDEQIRLTPHVTSGEVTCPRCLGTVTWSAGPAHRARRALAARCTTDGCPIRFMS